MANFIDCWALVSGKGYKHKDGSEVVNSHDRAAILERINEHIKSGLPPAEAQKSALASHIAEADGQLQSIYEQAPGLKPKEAAPSAEASKLLLTPTVRVGEQSFKGRAHPLAIGEASKSLAPDAPIEDLFKPESQGFTATDPATGKERFIGRKEAAEIFQKQTGKKTAAPDKLTSEDLRDAGLLGHMDEKAAASPGKPAATVETSPLPERFRDKPVTEIAELVKGATAEEVVGYRGTSGGGPTGFMWDIGAKARTPEDVAALRKIAEESALEGKALMDAGDLEGAMKIIGRQPSEAYEYATGVKLDGTPKWETFEKMAQRNGKTYKPPVPDAQYVKANGEAETAPEPVKTAPAAVPEHAAILKQLPPVPAGHVRLFHGEGGPQGGGTGGAFYTSNITKASTFGPDISWVDLPTAKAQAAFAKAKASSFAGGDNFILEPADIIRSKKINQKVEQPTHVLDEPDTVTVYRGEGEKYTKATLDKMAPHQKEYMGEWFTESKKDAENYAKTVGGKVREIKLPRAELEKYRISGLDEFRIPAAAQLPKLTTPKGIAASVREPGALGGGEEGFISLAPIQNLVRSAAPSVKAAVDAVKDIAEGTKETGKEALGTTRMTDYRRSVLNWSAKLQKSFDEAATAQKDIQAKVPDVVRREGITNWIQADGDAAVLRQRAAATTDPKLKAGYEAALNLTPEEIAVANQVKQTYDALGQRGQAADVINNFKDNYVTQIWDLGKTKAPAGGSSRTLKERFKFSKASTFPTFFDGEQAGYSPKTKDISKLLPVYTHEMNAVIAARELVQQMSKGRASDGRPLVASRGGTVPAQGGGATLVMPKKIKGDTADYKVLANQPALQGWRWADKDSAGNPVFVKGDLALHPEAFKRIENVLGRSAIRQWYTTPTTKVAAIPKAIARGLDFANSETKKTMLGMLAPFHQVQTGTHAVGHRVNPFGNIPNIDLVNNGHQMDAAKHGLMMLPDRASEGQFMEGFNNSGLVSQIPGLGPLSDMYSNYLFKQYIPGLKFKTYVAILERNNNVYAAELSSGRMKPEDVKVLSAEQANAAYGHLNYADLGRNPTLQHMAQIGLLAPDFLEARGRFFGQALKGATGAKVGREQLVALATLAVSQAAAAYISAKLSGGEWDKEHPFEFHVGSRKYTMRSVPEDVSGLISNTRSFVHSRLSPLVGKGALQYLSGVDYAGRKVTAGQTTKELLTQPIPMTARSLPGIRELSGQDRPGAIKAWEQLAGAVGLKISRYNTRSKLNELHADWLKNSSDPKVKADYEQQQTATFPVSKYKSLDSALADRDEAGAIKAIADLKSEGQKSHDILKRMRPFVGEGINSRAKPLFHESHKLEAAFRNSLNPEQKAEYQKALAERKATYQEFLKAWRKRGSAAPSAPPIDFVPEAQ